MMRHSVATTLALLALSLPSLAAENPVSLRVHGGYGTMAMTDANNILEQVEDVLRHGGFNSDVDQLNGGLVFGGDVLARITPMVSLVFSYDRATSEVDHRVSAIDGFMIYNWGVEADFFSAGVLCFLWPSAPYYVIGKGGYGYGTSQQSLHVESQPLGEPPSLIDGGHEAEGSGFVIEVGVGGVRTLSKQSSLYAFGEISYRYRNLGAFEGRGWLDGEISDGTLRDAAGQKVDFDYSGVALKFGLGFGL